MTEKTNKIRRLCLNWHTPDFLPVSLQNPEWIDVEEHLDPRDFSEESAGKSYWSIPEMFTELSWVAERAEDIQTVIDDNSDTKPGANNECYVELLDNFRRVVVSLGRKAGEYYEAERILRESQEVKGEFIKYWQEYRCFLGRIRNSDQGEITMRVNRPGQRIISAIEDFRGLPVREDVLSDDLTRFLDVYNYCQRFNYTYANFEDNFFATYCQEFAQAVYIFFESFLYKPKECEAGKRIHELASWVEKVSNIYSITVIKRKKDKWSDIYRDAVWDNLQTLATGICKDIQSGELLKINSTPRVMCMMSYQEVRSAGILMDNLREAARNLDPDRIVHNSRLLKEYKDEHNERCVALLKSSLYEPLISFSGYFDCNNSSGIYTKLSEATNSKPMHMFTAVCNSLGYTLVQLTDELVKHLYVFEPEDCFDNVYKPSTVKISLAEALMGRLGGGLSLEGIKGYFSCCERKILAFLEMRGINPNTPKMFVKRKPCEKCEPLLYDWGRSGNSKIECDYLLPKGRRNKLVSKVKIY